ncbi:MAG: hypothetical protein ABJF23_28025 [Bryobacteraceae bacterium]
MSEDRFRYPHDVTTLRIAARSCWAVNLPRAARSTARLAAATVSDLLPLATN